MLPDLRKKENLHIVFWLIKDFAWLCSFKTTGMAMAIPTLLLSVWLTWKSRAMRADAFHNLAITFWILGNSVWMWGEFYCEDCSRKVALPFFVLGIISVLYYYLSERFVKYESAKGG